MNHEVLEKNVGLLIVCILVAVSFGGLVQILPLLFEHASTEPVPNLKPLTALQLEGRDIYMREGCAVCHTQMVRPLQSDLARVGGRYSDDWHAAHLLNPRTVVPVSNMPGYPWLFDDLLDGEITADKMRALRTLGVPYTDADIEGAQTAVAGVPEAKALIAYLQSLGQDMKGYGATP